VVVGVNAKWACRRSGARLCRGAKRWNHSGGAQRGHPEEKFAPRHRARIFTANFSIKIENAHEGFSFICEFAEYSQKGFLGLK